MPTLQEPTARRERRLLLIAAAFVVTGAVTLHLAYPAFTVGHLLSVTFAFGLSFATAHAVLSHRLRDRDPLLLPSAALLSGWGLLMVGRLAPNFLARQATWLLLSTLAMLVAAHAGENLRWLRRYRYTWLLAGLILLGATLLLGVNPSGYGPRLWLGLGGAYFQPSEPLKLLMVVYLASYLAERRELLLSTGHALGRLRLPPLAYAGPLLAMFGLTALLLASQQDLGAAMLFFFTFLVMLYLATGQWGYVAAGLAFFLLAGTIGYSASARVALRVDTWLDPWPDAADRAFQTVQSLLAFGAGGIPGQGIGLGRPTYIPAVHTDFVFAAIAEEFGLAGVMGVIALYGVLLVRGLRAAARVTRPFQRLLAAGLTAGLVIQAWVIMAGNARLAPIAGVTLPFLSYGGSSMLSTFVALGLLLRISSPGSRVRSPGTPAVRPDARLPARESLLRVACALGLALSSLAAVCGYWSVAHAGWLVAREDNPRRVEYEQHIIRGRIVDREGVALADVEVGPSGVVTRTYPMPQAAPVVGYASLRHGTGGIEAAFDESLRGEEGQPSWQQAWESLLHRPPQGRDVQLTLDADLQKAAQEALSGESGAVVLLDSRTGEVLAMASAPTFNPAQLDAEWDRLREDPAAPLVNRATQGLYQPGAALETLVLAEALRQEQAALFDPAPELTSTVRVNGANIGCLGEPVAGDLAAAYGAACPGPFAALGTKLGEAGLLAAIDRWRLTEPPPLEVPTEAGSWSPTDPALEAVGQGSLTASPLAMALVAATLANQGTVPAPRLVLRLQGPQGGWQASEDPGSSRAVITPDAARRLLAAWQPYAARDNLAHLGTAAAGEDRPPHAWFLAIAPANSPRYALAVLLEHPQDPRQAADVGSALLEEALEQ
jgi:cell division protein FtsW (lipid II flippase)/cell division protein FtsI/penicillin-binding protein 2